jgi:hypothetical protein
VMSLIWVWGVLSCHNQIFLSLLTNLCSYHAQVLLRLVCLYLQFLRGFQQGPPHRLGVGIIRLHWQVLHLQGVSLPEPSKLPEPHRALSPCCCYPCHRPPLNPFGSSTRIYR